MQTRQLGNTDLHITPIGFGAWAIGGGGWAFAWGDQDDADSIAAIHEALDLGINWIDTAAVYGQGHSELVIRKALEGVANRPYLFTKCGRTGEKGQPIGKCLQAASIRRECENSLKRLGVETIDLYQIHWPEPDEEVEEGWATLAELQREGKVRWIGVSNFSVSQLQRAAAIAPIASLQPNYSLLNRKIEAEVLPYVAANQIGVIGYSPMGSGLLTGAMTRERIAGLPENDWRRNNRNYQEPLLLRNLALVELLRRIGQRSGHTPGEVAIAWVLRRPEVTAAIVGARRIGQLRELIGAAQWRLTTDEIAEIESFLVANPGA
ncbi:aldo/keto reductase [Tuwongella immobilis]|uniref:NADP-dependent oxidoreductase domain-containing protein n=1 Tax=Tuwongella immobilis TaxID=692036 RepID=A0A6C2YJ70_9BACT|nr:aldo/keto reductase [Tuwongella immobilis]VIP01135.1 aldo keto reductase : Aldo/keto reductase OS=Chlorobaculum parvum (strain NCIB 8327) GN=Cpar_0257 PE=4 SV=1: Aldo_ket_red [Tuwongella immobilis]VTR97695.1 aldo keto reductase : Aldo/keto reductase OS=Chlorobaculum parvum (strain NCIB 8327) GN=Cpar_0257 PE=4 SV=1: Aldo_ket_red [Tuwongella immobilis]